MRICADRSGFSFREWRTVIAREELRNELPYCRQFDIVSSTCITSMSGGAGGGVARRVCGNRAKQGAHRKPGQATGKVELIVPHALHAAMAAAARADWILHRVTPQLPNKRESPKSLAYRSSELAAVLHLVRHGL
jgi:hypothetical protein